MCYISVWHNVLRSALIRLHGLSGWLDMLQFVKLPCAILVTLKLGFCRSKARVSHAKSSLFRVLDSMDAAADPLNPLPAFVWQAVLVGYAAQLRSPPELSQRKTTRKASSESLHGHLWALLADHPHFQALILTVSSSNPDSSFKL